MPRTRRNPVTGTPASSAIETLDPAPIATNSLDIEPSGYALPFGLPEGFDMELPNFAELASSAIGFAPNPALPRVTQSDREVHKVIYEEQRHAAANLKDSIDVAIAYVDAAVSATKLGRGVVKYQTGVEQIREAMVNLDSARVKTSIAQQNLVGLQNELTYVTQENVHKLEVFDAKLEQWRVKVQGSQLQAKELTHAIQTKYAHLLGDS